MLKIQTLSPTEHQVYETDGFTSKILATRPTRAEAEQFLAAEFDVIFGTKAARREWEVAEQARSLGLDVTNALLFLQLTDDSSTRK